MTTLKTRINDIPKMIGTPEKKIFESEKPFISKLKMIVYVDLDNTLCITEETDYKNSKPIDEN